MCCGIFIIRTGSYALDIKEKKGTNWPVIPGGITPTLFNTIIKNAMWYHTRRATTYSKLKMKGVSFGDA